MGLFKNQIIILLYLSLVITSGASAASHRRHFMIVYGFQDAINTPRNSHTFATFLELSWSDSTGDFTGIQVHTISWYPTSMEIRFYRLLPEGGLNLELTETLALAASRGVSVIRWGPVEISEDLYFTALRQIDFLNSGAVDYIAEDRFLRNAAYSREPGGAINCIHAVSDLGGFIRTGFLHGFSAARRTYDHLRQFVVPSPDNNEWVAKQIGIADIPRADSI